MVKAKMIAQFLRAQAWWRLDTAGISATRVARSVVSLLDATLYLQDVPDDHPDILALETGGCFLGGVFYPGPEGAVIVREWQMADKTSAGPADLLAALARAVGPVRPGADNERRPGLESGPEGRPGPESGPEGRPGPESGPEGRPEPRPGPAAAAINVPRQPGPAAGPGPKPVAKQRSGRARGR